MVQKVLFWDWDWEWGPIFLISLLSHEMGFESFFFLKDEKKIMVAMDDRVSIRLLDY